MRMLLITPLNATAPHPALSVAQLFFFSPVLRGRWRLTISATRGENSSNVSFDFSLNHFGSLPSSDPHC